MKCRRETEVDVVERTAQATSELKHRPAGTQVVSTCAECGAKFSWVRKAVGRDRRICSAGCKRRRLISQRVRWQSRNAGYMSRRAVDRWQRRQATNEFVCKNC